MEMGKTVISVVCGRIKKPIGRDSMNNGLCDSDCKGYMLDPYQGHLWPGETQEEYGY